VDRWKAASLSLSLVGLVMAGGAVAHGAPQPAPVTAVVPASSLGAFVAVAAVPHSADVWAVGSVGAGVDNDHFFEARRHLGKWQRVAPPKLGGRYGSLDAVAAASTKNVWIAGARQVAGIQELPAIYRLSGQKFVAQKLPSLQDGLTSITSISASSATNAWAVGGIYSTGPSASTVALRWNGQKWAAVDTPTVFEAVSTSGPNNAWAVGEGSGGTPNQLYSWNGSVWSLAATAPAGAQLNDVTTDSAARAYAIGFVAQSSGGFRTVILRYNGKTWSSATIAKAAAHVESFSITMAGASAWAVGGHLTAKDTVIPEILHSSGGPWTLQSSHVGKAFGLRWVSASSTSRVYAVGDSLNAERISRTFFEVYNGHAWKPAPSKL
jgi:hypothetical protein